MRAVTWVGRNVWIAVLALAVGFVASAVAADTELERRMLAGLAGVYVLVGDMKPDAEKDGLAGSTLQTDVELKLRQAGIRVLTSGEWLAAPGNPSLYLFVGTVKNETGLYAYYINLELHQEVRLTRNPAITSLATTWHAPGFVGIVLDRNLSKVRDGVRDVVDQFLNAYLAANPKR